MLTVLPLLLTAQALPTDPRYNCSLNGDLIEASNGTVSCLCDAQWAGPDCERLKLLEVDPVVRGLDGGSNFSTWGGSVARDERDGTYHMFVSLFEHGCGLNAWRPNSAIARATAAAPEGPYTLRETLKPHFAHSPDVMRDSQTGDWLVFHVGAGANDTRPCADPASDTCGFTRNCSGGCTGPLHPWESGLTFYGPVSVLRSVSPLGPWEDHEIGTCDQVPGCAKNATYRGNGNDINPAPFELTGTGAPTGGMDQTLSGGPGRGEVLMLWRSIDYSSKGQSYYARATAPTWSGPYSWSTANLFPGFEDCHIEDGHVYSTRRGLHALFHSDCEVNRDPGARSAIQQ